MTELTKEDYELSHEMFVKKYRHLPTYFKLLFLKKQGYVEPEKPVVKPVESSKKKSTKKSKKSITEEK